MKNIVAQFKKLKIIPVITLETSEGTDRLASALIEGGLPCAEITLRTEAGLDAIKKMSQNGTILVGAGTVLTKDQASKAQDAGAGFVVSPGFNPEVVQHCIDSSIPIFPGISNPTDIEMALSFGLTNLKFFPAEAYGGVKTIKALSSPYPMVNFLPTGGISEKNIRDYLAQESVIACGGSWLVKSEWLKAGDYDRIVSTVQSAIKLVEKND